jgi:hypothetical protein
MINATMPSQPKPILDNPKTTTATRTTIPNSVPFHDQVRERAYQLYEIRGREAGQDEQDWFRAEQEILKQPQ